METINFLKKKLAMGKSPIVEEYFQLGKIYLESSINKSDFDSKRENEKIKKRLEYLSEEMDWEETKQAIERIKSFVKEKTKELRKKPNKNNNKNI